MVEARIARALNLREDSDLLAADQEHLLELMDEFFDNDDPPVIPTHCYTYIIHYSHYNNNNNNNNAS